MSLRKGTLSCWHVSMPLWSRLMAGMRWPCHGRLVVLRDCRRTGLLPRHDWLVCLADLPRIQTWEWHTLRRFRRWRRQGWWRRSPLMSWMGHIHVSICPTDLL